MLIRFIADGVTKAFNIPVAFTSITSVSIDGTPTVAYELNGGFVRFDDVPAAGLAIDLQVVTPSVGTGGGVDPAVLDAEAISEAELPGLLDTYGVAKTSDLAGVGAIAGEVRMFNASTPSGWTRKFGAKLSNTELMYAFGLIPGHASTASSSTNRSLLHIAANGILNHIRQSDLSQYNPVSRAWTTPSGLTGIGQVGGPLADGRVLSIGGAPGSDSIIWNPVDMSYTYVANTPIPLRDASICRMADGKMFVAGGSTTGGTLVANCYIYDPVANTWNTTVPNLPTSAQAAPIIALCGNGKILHVAGTAAHVYDPVANTWATAANSPTNTTNNGGAFILADGRTALVGSGTGLFFYNSSTNTWSTMYAALPISPVLAIGLQLPNGDLAITNSNGSTSVGLRTILVVPMADFHFAQKN